MQARVPLVFLRDSEANASEGEYFIDRDGEFFAPILTYLRSGELRVPTGIYLCFIHMC